MTQKPSYVWGKILRKWVADLVELIIKLAGLALLILGAILLIPGVVEQGNRLVEWLKTGVWRPYPLREWLLSHEIDAPQIGWVVPQRILNWVLDWPFVLAAGLSIMLVTIAFALMMAFYEDLADRERRE